jgi:hypothetical protein
VLFFVVLLGGGVGWTARDHAARRAETGRQVHNSLAAARSLLAESKPAQARQKLAEAKAQLGQDRGELSALASEVDVLDAELARFDEFFALIDRANEAQIPAGGVLVVGSASSIGKDVPFLLKALALYGVLERDDWSSTLKGN